MNCRESENLISQYLDGEIPEDLRREFEEHIASCEACRGNLAAYQSLDKVLAEASPVLPDEGYWSGFDARLNEKIDRVSQRKPWWDFIFSSRKQLAWVGLLLILAVGIFNPAIRNAVFYGNRPEIRQVSNQSSPMEPAVDAVKKDTVAGEESAERVKPVVSGASGKKEKEVAGKPEVESSCGVSERKSKSFQGESFSQSAVKKIKASSGPSVSGGVIEPAKGRMGESASTKPAVPDGGIGKGGGYFRSREVLQKEPVYSESDASSSSGAIKKLEKKVPVGISKVSSESGDVKSADEISAKTLNADFYKNKEASVPGNGPMEDATSRIDKSCEPDREAERNFATATGSAQKSFKAAQALQEEAPAAPKSKNVAGGINVQSPTLAAKRKSYLDLSEAIAVRAVNLRESAEDLESLQRYIKVSGYIDTLAFMDSVSYSSPSMKKHVLIMQELVNDVMEGDLSQIRKIKDKVKQTKIIQYTRRLRGGRY